MGHSFGGNALVNVALINPRLFSALVLLDPVISRFSSTPGVLAQSPATASIYRRDEWPSRPAAAEAFRRSPFYRAWDDRVFDRWMRYGVVPKAAAAADDDGGPVTLATPTPQEVFTYLRPSWHAYDEKANKVTDRDLLPDLDEAATDNVHPSYPFYRPEPVSTLFRLTHVRPPVFYVFGRTSNLSSAELIQEKLDLTGAGAGGSGGKAHGRVAHVIGDYGHLIPLEAPGFCARSAAPWLKRELERWRSQEDEYEAWVSKSLREKTSISDEYKSHAPRPPKPGKDKAKI